VQRHDLALEEGGREVAVYTVTDDGEAEFVRLLIQMIETVPDSGDALPLRVALNFAPALTRSRMREALERRIETLDLCRDALVGKQRHLATLRTVPPHVISELGFELALVRAQLDWLTEFAAEVRAGGLVFEGEGHGGWVPGPDDPGWKMKAESEQYAKKLGLAPRPGSFAADSA
jgi:hypothetical protein